MDKELEDIRSMLFPLCDSYILRINEKVPVLTILGTFLGGITMQQKWEMDELVELVEHFTLLPQEMELISNKTGTTRLGFAVLLKVFQHEARFPIYKHEVPIAIVQYIAKQMKLEPSLYSRYNWSGRTIKYHRAQIRDFFGFREGTVQDAKSIGSWLERHAMRPEQNGVSTRYV